MKITKISILILSLIIGVSFSVISFANIDASALTGGNYKGSVVLIEYYDYQCPHCRVMNQIIEKLINDNPELKVEYHPIAGFGYASYFESAAVIAANQQGKLKVLHNELMSKFITRPEGVFYLANQLGLDVKKLSKDMRNFNVSKILKQNFSDLKGMYVREVPVILLKKSTDAQIKYKHIGETSGKQLQQEILELTKKSNKEQHRMVDK